MYLYYDYESRPHHDQCHKHVRWTSMDWTTMVDRGYVVKFMRVRLIEDSIKPWYL